MKQKIPLLKKVFSLVLAICTCVTMLGVMQPTKAQAESEDVSGAITEFSVNKTLVYTWNSLNVSLKFSEDQLGKNIEPGDTITVTWPTKTSPSDSGAYFTVTETTKDLYKSGTTTKLATAVISDGSAVITFTNEVKDLQHVTGYLEFSLTGMVEQGKSDGDYPADITVGEKTQTVTIRRDTSSTGPETSFGVKGHGAADYDSITWSFYFNKNLSDVNPNSTATMTDYLPDGVTVDTSQGIGTVVYYDGNKKVQYDSNWTKVLTDELGGTFTYDADTNKITITIPGTAFKYTDTTDNTTYNTCVYIEVPTTYDSTQLTGTHRGPADVLESDSNAGAYYDESRNLLVNSAYFTYTPADSTTPVENTDSTSAYLPYINGGVDGVPNGTIRISKVLSGQTVAVEGVEFHVYKLDSNGNRVKNWTSETDTSAEKATDADGYEYLIATTDSDGLADVDNLNDGDYELVEYTAPENLVIKTTQSVKVTLSTDSSSGSNQGTMVSIGNADASQYVTIKKVDKEDQAALENAEFTLYSDSDCSNAIKTYTTDSEGKANITLADIKDYLPTDPDTPQTLYLKETTAPDGYKTNDQVYKLIVDLEQSSSVSEDKKTYESATDYTMTFEGSSTSDTLTVEDERNTDTETVHNQLSISKVDSANTATVLSGAEFTLYTDEECTNAVPGAIYITGQDGRAVVSTKDDALQSLLPEAGETTTLYVKETQAPAGYDLNTDVHTIEIGAEQNSEWKDVNGVRTYVTTTTYTISSADAVDSVLEITDSKTPTNPDTAAANETVHNQLTINKVDSEDTASFLSGAEFTLYKDAACTTPVDGAVYTTGANGKAFISTSDTALSSLLPAAGNTTTLYLKETQAPEGYDLNTDVYQITISAEQSSALKDINGVLTNITTTTYSIQAADASDGALTVQDSKTPETPEQHDSETPDTPNQNGSDNPETPDNSDSESTSGQTTKTTTTTTHTTTTVTRTTSTVYPKTADINSAVPMAILLSAAGAMIVLIRRLKSE